MNVVGDHATHHKKYDAPLESDIDPVAGSVSGWVRRSDRVAEVGADAAAAVAASMEAPGQVATLILPADASWDEGGQVAEPLPSRTPAAPGPQTVSIHRRHPPQRRTRRAADRRPGLP